MLCRVVLCSCSMDFCGNSSGQDEHGNIGLGPDLGTAAGVVSGNRGVVEFGVDTGEFCDETEGDCNRDVTIVLNFPSAVFHGLSAPSADDRFVADTGGGETSAIGEGGGEHLLSLSRRSTISSKGSLCWI